MGKSTKPYGKYCSSCQKLPTTESNPIGHACSIVTGTGVRDRSAVDLIISASCKAEKEAVSIDDDDANEQDRNDQEGSKVEGNIVK